MSILIMTTIDLGRLDFAKGGGLVTVVTQDARSGVVLMVAHADREALEKCVETGEMHYRSRTRGLWRKGATSGNTQRIVSLAADCDSDAILARVISDGPACHTGTRSCFGELVDAEPLGALDRVIGARADASSPTDNPTYTQRLLGDRNLRLKKIGEECAELVVALADADKARATEEAADVVYHTLVALRAIGVALNDIRAELAARAERAAST
jgi:phosphoribosyl-AMP cyclohydrolase / phosphoribosyl-ATP pyrophosphohydrolase